MTAHISKTKRHRMKRLPLTFIFLLFLLLGVFSGYFICALNADNQVALLSDLLDDEANMYKRSQQRYYRTMQDLYELLANGREIDAKNMVREELQAYGLLESLPDGASAK